MSNVNNGEAFSKKIDLTPEIDKNRPQRPLKIIPSFLSRYHPPLSFQQLAPFPSLAKMQL
jgi:hypothetical protein